MERRNFIKTAAIGGVAGAFGMQAKAFAENNNAPEVQSAYDLVAVMGGEPEVMYARAIESLGGIRQFVKSGSRVIVKPNIGWDRAPEFAANTNPELVVAVIKDCLAAGAREVGVFDNTCDEWRPCYKNSGIEDAVVAAGGKILYGHEERYYRTVNIPAAKRLKTCKIHEAILDYDVWINIPVLKNHGGTRMTIAMKNYMGIVWDRRYMHSNDLQQCIADITLIAKKPVLTIVDAYRIITQNGPKGRSLADVQTPKALFMGTDLVAIDTAAVRFFSQYQTTRLEDVGHIIIGNEMKIGTTDIDNLRINRIRI